MTTRHGHHSLVEYLRWRHTLPDLMALPEEDAWFAFRDAHEGRCATCRNDAEQLLVDHDHTTGLIRGLLCPSCNRLAPSWATHASRVALSDLSHVLVLYTQWPPAAVAGMRQRYVSPWIWDPAPDVHRILWHAGPDGIEHNRERLQAQMDAAIMSLPVLSDFPEEE